MTSSAVSKNGVPVRLADERWKHITANYPGLAGEKAIILDTVTNRTYAKRREGAGKTKLEE